MLNYMLATLGPLPYPHNDYPEASDSRAQPLFVRSKDKENRLAHLVILHMPHVMTLTK